MSKLLFAWIGQTDLNAAAGDPKAGDGPIASAVKSLQFDQINLLTNYPKKESENFVRWLKRQKPISIELYVSELSSPMHFGEIYDAAVRTISATLGKDSGVKGIGQKSNVLDLTFHISPGTSAMAAVWVIVAKTRFPATLIQSSIQRGVEVASVPFDISADFIPDLLRGPDRNLEHLIVGPMPEAPEFKDIIHRSSIMKELIAKAGRVSPRSVPVLIEGESGTGKELLARAIHRASPRRDGPFIAINCGAIPSELVESEFFGHEKGAFTGANSKRIGHFEQALGGTLFLDEIGELPLPMQVKLLRVLQEKEIVRLGSSQTIKVDVRIISATNRSLIKEVTEGRFREDLFYRLAVIFLKVPPLRERRGDLSLLVNYLLEEVNKESQEEPGYKQKKLSAAARNLLASHLWPGNIRELYNTIRRAAIWSNAEIIEAADMKEALLPQAEPKSEEILDRPLGDGLKLQEIIAFVARHYLDRAIHDAHGNKTEAAGLLGLSSYQTLTNWIKKYNVDL